MKFEELMIKLRAENEIEREQRTQGHNVNDLHLPYDKIKVPKMPQSSFFVNSNIFINKHHRYSVMPAHTHEFVEFNYMLSGSCVQYVNNKRIDLQEGELLLIDKEVVQKIDALGKKDILINILLKDDSITTELVANMVRAKSLVNDFLLNASNQYSNHNSFIHFHYGDNYDIQKLLHKLILEYYNKANYFQREMNLLLSVLLIELTREIEKKSLQDYQEKDEVVLDILRYIDTEFKDLTLSKLSKHFVYNVNYLGNKLKKDTGRTFQELVSKRRYHYALELLNETDLGLEEVSAEIGFQSVTSLYKLFRKYTKQTPKEIRLRQNGKKEKIIVPIRER